MKELRELREYLDDFPAPAPPPKKSPTRSGHLERPSPKFLKP